MRSYFAPLNLFGYVATAALPIVSLALPYLAPLDPESSAILVFWIFMSGTLLVFWLAMIAHRMRAKASDFPGMLLFLLGPFGALSYFWFDVFAHGTRSRAPRGKSRYK